MSGLFRSFLKDARGVSALMFGMSVPVIALAVGGGIDFSQAAARRQRIASAVEIGCLEASLKINSQSQQTGADPKKDYTSVANAEIKGRVTDLSQSGVTGVTVTSRLANNIITAVATATSTNSFGGILGYNTVALRVERNCNYVLGTPGGGSGGGGPGGGGSGGPGTVMFLESWETGHNVASNSWSVLKNWNGWTTQSSQGGIEINGIPELAANTIRFGNFFAELDSHCYTSGCKTNSSMWREFTNLAVGNYELSYWYISRVRNTAYAGQTLCAYTTDAKAVWDKLKAATWESQTNRIEVFFQKKSSSYSTPSKDVDKATDQVDVCVHTDQWTERKIPLKVTTAGTYRIFFQAAGREDTYGGLIDYIRFCSGKCP